MEIEVIEEEKVALEVIEDIEEVKEEVIELVLLLVKNLSKMVMPRLLTPQLLLNESCANNTSRFY